MAAAMNRREIDHTYYLNSKKAANRTKDRETLDGSMTFSPRCVFGLRLLTMKTGKLVFTVCALELSPHTTTMTL